MALGEVISRLSVELSLNSAAFEKGSRKAGQDADAFGDRMEKMGHRTGRAIKGIAAAGAALAAGFVVNQLKDMVVQSLEYASSLGEVSQQLGVTTRELQQYRYIATQVGIEQEEMDKGLSNLTKTLGKLSQGAKGPTEALQKLGLSEAEIARVSKMTAGEAIPVLADAFAKLKSPTEQAALAAELFGGKLGPKFLTLLTGGSTALNDLTASFDKLGIELSPEMIARADEAADKMAALKTVLDAKMAILVADNADSIVKLADAMVEGLAAAGRFYNAIVAFGDSTFGKALSALNRLAGLATPLGLLSEGFDRITGAMGRAEKAAPKAAAAVKAAAPVAWPTGGGGSIPTMLRKPNAPKIYSGPMAKNPGLAGGLDKWAEFIPGVMNDNIKVFNDWEKSGEKAADAVGTSFSDAATSVVNSLGSMANAIKGGGILDILSSVLGLGLQLAGLGVFGKKIQTNVQARAIGGSISAGRPYLVGERGPELVVPSHGGRVVPNNKLGAGGGVMEIRPSPLFEVYVDGKIVQAAPSIAAGGAKMAGMSAARSNKWALGR